jgi:hypothetical protein
VSADGTEVPLTRAQKEQNKQMDAQIADYGRLHPGALYTNRDIIGKSGIELGRRPCCAASTGRPPARWTGMAAPPRSPWTARRSRARTFI